MMMANSDHTTLDVRVQGFLLEHRSEDDTLVLKAHHHPDFKPIFIDWCGAELQRRIAGGRKQLLAKAIGLPRKPDLRVLDATGGLGRDAFTLASLGATVTLCERNPTISALLADAQRRALQNPQHAPAAQRLSLQATDARELLSRLRPGEGFGENRPWDCVYLDPMYPEDGKTALPSKEMQLFRELTGGDADADDLLEIALNNAPRVVVKRPTKAPWLAQQRPSMSLSSAQVRFDLYLPITAAAPTTPITPITPIN